MKPCSVEVAGRLARDFRCEHRLEMKGRKKMTIHNHHTIRINIVVNEHWDRIT
jgi:hypothetical protein